MTDDIVTRLREQLGNVAELFVLMDDATGEIERLREQNEYLKANVEQLVHEAVRGD